MNNHKSVFGASVGVAIPSDLLAPLRELTVCHPSLKLILGQVPVIRVVPDACVALEEVAYISVSRRKACARTALEELIDSGTVVVYAPPTIDREVDRHLGKIARRRGVPLARLRATWNEFRSRINMYNPDPEPLAARQNEVDVNDLPYYAVLKQLGIQAVYTNDRDLVQMGASSSAV